MLAWLTTLKSWKPGAYCTAHRQLNKLSCPVQVSQFPQVSSSRSAGFYCLTGLCTLAALLLLSLSQLGLPESESQRCLLFVSGGRSGLMNLVSFRDFLKLLELLSALRCFPIVWNVSVSEEVAT